jgi:lipid A 3-O-deacylase
MSMKKLCAAVLASVALSGCASHRFSLYEENDAFAYGQRKNDANYTQGIQMVWEDKREFAPCTGAERPGQACDSGTVAKVLDTINLTRLPMRGLDDNSRLNEASLRWEVGQQFYTPDDITAAEIIPSQRPYAGWLYAGVAVHNDSRDMETEDWLDRRRTSALRVGVVGPSSHGEHIQRWWHREFNHTPPEGWDNQLRDEPGFIYSLSQENRVLRIAKPAPGGTFGADVVTEMKVSAGNIYTGADVGATLRFGYNVPRDFGKGTIGAIRSGPTEAPPAFSLYGRLGVHGRAVAHDLFLDGNTFRNSHSVDKELLVGDAIVGFGIRYKWVTAEMRYVQRSTQYDTQPLATNFGSILLTIDRNWDM